MEVLWLLGVTTAGLADGLHSRNRHQLQVLIGLFLVDTINCCRSRTLMVRPHRAVEVICILVTKNDKEGITHQLHYNTAAPYPGDTSCAAGGNGTCNKPAQCAHGQTG
jgi:hypothetical protein